MTKKMCIRCKQLKTKFYKSGIYAGGRDLWCIDCRKAYQKVGRIVDKKLNKNKLPARIKMDVGSPEVSILLGNSNWKREIGSEKLVRKTEKDYINENNEFFKTTERKDVYVKE